jgi:MFS family permease
MSDTQLRRNRDFRILSAASGLSMLGTEVSAIAFPLLVLRATRSPADAGLVGFAEGVALAVALLPGGAVADRHNRRAVMLISDLACLMTMLLLCVTILLGHAPLGVLLPAAVITTAFGALSGPAAGAALRLIVTDPEMPGAISVNQARNAVLFLIGPALGGLLFEVSPSLPFLADAVSYALCLAGTLAIRTRLAAPAKAGDPEPLLAEILAGVRFIWGRRLLRITMMNASVLNFAFNGVLLALIVTSVRAGSTGLATGTIVTCVGLGSLAGSLLAPAAAKRLSLHQAVMIVTGVCLIMVTAMAFTRNLVILAALASACAVFGPALNVLVGATQTMATPDALQGRVQSAMAFLALSTTPLGTVAAGFLLARWAPAVTFLAFAAAIAVLAVVGISSRSLRDPVTVAPSVLADERPAPRPSAP